jgi:hypothetical protein
MSETRRIQLAIAIVFLGLGGWCLIHPSSVIALTVRPEYRADHPLVRVVLGAFGAQAMLVGILAAFATFNRRTFLAFGLAILPFFGFDVWFYFVMPLFNWLILLDVAGNIALVALCWLGHARSKSPSAQ